MPVGIDTRGVILRALGEYMRKFMRFPPRTLRFRSLLILAGAFALLAAFTPRANAGLLCYYNMEGSPPTGNYPVNLDSHPPALVTGAGTTLFLDNGTAGVPYPSTRTRTEPGLPGNIAPGDPAPNLNSLGITRNGQALWAWRFLSPPRSSLVCITSRPSVSRGLMLETALRRFSFR